MTDNDKSAIVFWLGVSVILFISIVFLGWWA